MHSIKIVSATYLACTDPSTSQPMRYMPVPAHVLRSHQQSNKAGCNFRAMWCTWMMVSQSSKICWPPPGLPGCRDITTTENRHIFSSLVSAVTWRGHDTFMSMSVSSYYQIVAYCTDSTKHLVWMYTLCGMRRNCALHQTKKKKKKRSILFLSTVALIWGALLDCREQNITVYTFIHYATWT